MTASIGALRAREAELQRQLARMLQMVDRAPFLASALEMQQQLQRVLGQWRAMFVLRDQSVYRAVAAGGDPARKLVAIACQRRMAALAEEVEDFARSWSSSALIATAFLRFRANVLVLVAAIAGRLESEQRLLGAPPRQLVA